MSSERKKNMRSKCIGREYKVKKKEFKKKLKDKKKLMYYMS